MIWDGIHIPHELVLWPARIVHPEAGASSNASEQMLNQIAELGRLDSWVRFA